MDATAKGDCEIVIDLLTAEGLSPVMVDDSALGVPEGVYEVRVPSQQAGQAEETIASNPLPDEVEEVDNSSDLDLQTIYHSEGSATAEFEALSIKNVLESNGIAVVMVGDSVLPNLGFDLKIPRDQVDLAQQFIAEAQRGGPAAAEKAEQESEAGAKGSPQ